MRVAPSSRSASCTTPEMATLAALCDQTQDVVRSIRVVVVEPEAAQDAPVALIAASALEGISRGGRACRCQFEHGILVPQPPGGLRRRDLALGPREAGLLGRDADGSICESSIGVPRAEADADVVVAVRWCGAAVGVVAAGVVEGDIGAE